MNKPRGRPKLAAQDKRTVRLAIKLSPAEKVALTDRAKAQKMTLARSVRSDAMKVLESPGS